ncbi:MAG: UbiD family decarboxylase [Syntrophorhabdaceae bacterium]|nr:UbiD family decarboxylase [Syntrophorhabdaceae bacterium]
MKKKDVTSVRAALEYLDDKGEVIHITNEVDPLKPEIAGIQRGLDEGPALLFENIKGYPNFRNCGNILSRRDRICDLYDAKDQLELKERLREGIRKPLAPKVVSDGPVQEVLIDKDIDVLATLPIIQHGPDDAGRILGGGINLLMGKYFGGGTNVSFNRTHFRGKDWASQSHAQLTHIGQATQKYYKDEIVPVTVNINPPLSVQMVAGAWNVRTIVPRGSDELGIAGAFQGSPINIVKAKTQDTYACADSEIVIEGYYDTSTVWETEEAEKAKVQREKPFFPEWEGYLGRSWIVRKLQVTGITYRKAKPIFHTAMARGFEYAGYDLLREAGLMEMADRIAPGIVVDCFVPIALQWGGGVIFQVRKTKAQEEGLQRNILTAAFANCPGMRLAVAVDEDIDIYNMDDVLWAIETRVDPKNDILTFPGQQRGIVAQPQEPMIKGLGGWEGGMGFDATKPFVTAWRFTRGHYPSDTVDYKRWLTDEQIARVQAQQSDYAKTCAKHGW